MPRALILLTNGNYRVTELDSVNDYQAIVGGYVEMLLTVDDSITCYVNEEGRLRALTPNPWSRFLVEIGVRGAAVVVGNVIVFGDADEDGNDMDVPERIVGLARQYGIKEEEERK